jgi:hypothetical protein
LRKKSKKWDKSEKQVEEIGSLWKHWTKYEDDDDEGKNNGPKTDRAADRGP